VAFWQPRLVRASPQTRVWTTGEEIPYRFSELPSARVVEQRAGHFSGSPRCDRVFDLPQALDTRNCAAASQRYPEGKKHILTVALVRQEP
jgi:hypothetical protein